MSDERNCSIDIFRLCAAFLVVAIHTSPFSELNDDIYFLFTDVIARIAVPFFFCTTGYYFSKRLNEKKEFHSYFKSLLIPYSIWSGIYAIFNIVLKLFDHSIKSFTDLLKFLFEGFFLLGTNEHLWFYPAMFIALVIMIILYKARISDLFIPLGIVLFIIMVMSTAYSEILGDLVLLKYVKYKYVRSLCVAIPYMALGYILTYFDKVKLKNAITIPLTAICFTVYYFEKDFVRSNNTGRSYVNVFSLYLFIAVFMLFLINNPKPNLKRYAGFSRRASGFIYFVHPIISSPIGFLFGEIYGLHFETLTFFITCILSVGIFYFIYRKHNKKNLFFG